MYDIVSSNFFDSVNIIKEAHILVPTHPPQPFPTHIPVEVPDNFNGDISSLGQTPDPNQPDNNIPQDNIDPNINNPEDGSGLDDNTQTQQPDEPENVNVDGNGNGNGVPSESEEEPPADLSPLKKYILYQKLKELKRKIENNQYNFSNPKDYDNITFELNILLSNYQIFNSEQISDILTDFEQKLLLFGIQPNTDNNEDEDIDNNEDKNNEMINDNLNEQ